MPGAQLQKITLYLMLFLTVMLSLTAQDAAAPAPMGVSVTIEGDPEGEAPTLTNLFRESLLIELELAGLMIVAPEESDVAVTGSYDVTGSRIGYRLLAALPDGELLYEAEAAEQFGLALDTVLLNRAERLTAAIVAYRGSRPDQFVTTPAEVGVTTGSDQGTEKKPEIEVLQPEKPAGITEGVPAAGGFELAVDFGLFLAAGEAGRYFKTGYWPSFFIGYADRSGRSYGASSGVMYFNASGYAAGLQGVIVPLLPEFRYRVSSGGKFSPGFKLGIGGAMMTVFPDVGDSQTKFIPAAEAGLLTGFAFGSITVQISLDVALFYENQGLLYGFAPRIGIYF